MERGLLPRLRPRFLLAMLAVVVATAVCAVAAKAEPITPVTFCLDGQTVTFTDTTQVWTHGWRVIEATPTAIAFLTRKAQTTGVFLLADKHGKFHEVTVSLGPCVGGEDQGDEEDDD